MDFPITAGTSIFGSVNYVLPSRRRFQSSLCGALKSAIYVNNIAFDLTNTRLFLNLCGPWCSNRNPTALVFCCCWSDSPVIISTRIPPILPWLHKHSFCSTVLPRHVSSIVRRVSASRLAHLLLQDKAIFVTITHVKKRTRGATYCPFLCSYNPI